MSAQSASGMARAGRDALQDAIDRMAVAEARLAEILPGFLDAADKANDAMNLVRHSAQEAGSASGTTVGQQIGDAVNRTHEVYRLAQQTKEGTKTVIAEMMAHRKALDDYIKRII